MGTEKFYVPGTFYRCCDRTGFATRSWRTQQEWNGKIVRKQSWEVRHPQDFVRGVKDDQTVPQARPRQVDTFLGALSTTLTADVAAGSGACPVASSVRMLIGDSVTIMLDTGSPFSTFISVIPNATSITVSPVLPWKASSGNVVIDLSAVSTANIG